jgi:Uma2 family endonuclease
MAQHISIASWAEEVPSATYPTTIDDLLALPEDANWQYEVVDGRLVRMPASGWEASQIAARLIFALGTFVYPRNLGRISGADGTFNLTPPGAPTATGLVPDVAFVRASRIPPHGSADYKKALHLAPDLVAEVVSPNQFRPEVFDKVKVYLAAGVQLVWVIWPARQQVDVWPPPIPAADQPTTQLSLSDALDGLHVLPGFSYPLADLFA